MLPLVNTASFPLLLAARIVYGFGFGFLYAFCQNLVSGLFTFEDQPRMMGLGTTFQTIGVILFSMGGVALSKISFNCVWLIHLIFVLPLALAFFLKEPENKVAAVEETKTAVKSNDKIPGSTWFVILCFGIAGLAMMNMFLFISDIVAANGFGGSVEAGLVTTIFGIAGVAGSAVYTAVANKVTKFALPLGALIFAIGFFVIGSAQSIYYMYIGAAIAEFGFVWMFPSGFNLIAKITPPSKVPAANGLVSTAFNGFAFCTSYVMLFLLKLFGKSDDLRFAFTIGAVLMLAVAVALFFFKPKVHEEPVVQTE
jgi:MFS family permease